MISVVIPALNAASRLGACLDALIPATLSGLVKEAVIVDGGSDDATVKIAHGFGARVLVSASGRGGQLQAGANAARGDWLLFLHADTVLEENWAQAAARFMEVDQGKAAVFHLAFDAKGVAPKMVAAGAMARTRLLASPYGDQGLFLSRALYDEIGGFRALPLFEDVDIIGRLIKMKGRKALKVLDAKAVTSAARYEREGYVKQVLFNALRLMRYRLGASPETLARGYR